MLLSSLSNLPVPEDDPRTPLPKEVDFLFKNIFQTKGSKTSSENRYKADDRGTYMAILITRWKLNQASEVINFDVKLVIQTRNNKSLWM